MWTNIITTLLSVIKELIKWNSNRLFVEDKLNKLVLIYDNLNYLIGLPQVNSCAIVRIENSGGLINSNVPLYYSVLNEVVDDRVNTIKNETQKIRVNEDDVRVFLNAIREDSHFIKLTETTTIRKILVKNNLKWSYLFFLRATKKEIIFLNICGVDDLEMNQSIHLTFQLMAEKIKQLV